MVGVVGWPFFSLTFYFWKMLLCEKCEVLWRKLIFTVKNLSLVKMKGILICGNRISVDSPGFCLENLSGKKCISFSFYF